MSEDFSFDAQLTKSVGRLKELLPCCPNCEHFQWIVAPGPVLSNGYLPTQKEYCDLDPQKRLPPARIIAFGCPAFRPGVPF